MSVASSHMVKFQRACEHLESIHTIVESWSKVTTYKTVSEPDPDGSGLVHTERYVARIGGPPLPNLSALVGDCLNNFRGTLDHLIWFASILHTNEDPPFNPRHISFPIWDNRDTYTARGLHAVSSEVKAFVETLQPYHAGDDARSQPLWMLSELNNIDKHREIHTVGHVFLPSESFVASRFSGPWMDMIEGGPLEDGTVIARLHTPFSMSGNDMNVNLKVTHGVAIAHSETTPQAHLGNTLLAIRDAVTEAARGIFAVI